MSHACEHMRRATRPFSTEPVGPRIDRPTDRLTVRQPGIEHQGGRVVSPGRVTQIQEAPVFHPKIPTPSTKQWLNGACFARISLPKSPNKQLRLRRPIYII